MDDADRADLLIENVRDDGVAAAIRYSLNIPEGNPGECELCGSWCGRLVDGACSRCRDFYRLR